MFLTAVPVTRVSEFSYKETEDGFMWGGRSQKPGTLFRAKVDSPNRIIQVKIWYVYNDDEPYWRDLVWYPEFMVEGENGDYEGFVKGKLPDSWLVEVKDIARGFPRLCELSSPGYHREKDGEETIARIPVPALGGEMMKKGRSD